MLATLKPSFLLLLAGVAVSQFAHNPFLRTPYNAPEGHYHHEIIHPGGGVQGAYSYIPPTGKSINIKYPAGKHFFQHPHQFATFPGYFTANHIPQNLFTPATGKEYPPESVKQLENYNKALQEIEEEKEQEQRELIKSAENAFAEKAQSYVNVRVGGDKTYNYEYLY